MSHEKEVSPLPEYLKDWRVCELKSAFGIYENTGMRICTINNEWVGQKRIADYIVKSVNSHADLVAALEKVAALNPDAGEIGPGMLAQIVAQSRAALAKARA